MSLINTEIIEKATSIVENPSDFVVGIEFLIYSLKKLFVFIYPGAILICTYNWINFKKTVLNYSTAILTVSASFIIVCIAESLSGLEYPDFKNWHHICIFLVTVILPVVWNCVRKINLFRAVLAHLGITASMADDGLSRIMLENPKPGDDIYRVYLDGMGIMYRGHLKYRDHGTDGKQQICLTHFSRFEKIDKKTDDPPAETDLPYEPGYKRIIDYSSEPNRWVMVNMADITRWEVNSKVDKKENKTGQQKTKTEE